MEYYKNSIRKMQLKHIFFKNLHNSYKYTLFIIFLRHALYLKSNRFFFCITVFITVKFYFMQSYILKIFKPFIFQLSSKINSLSILKH